MNWWVVVAIIYMCSSVGYIVVYEMGGPSRCRSRIAVGGHCGDGLSGGGYYSGGGAGN